MQKIDTVKVNRDHPVTSILQRWGIKLSRDKMCSCINPSHLDKTPSMHVFYNGAKGHEWFHCHGCGEQGDTFDLFRLVKGYSFMQTVEELGAMPPEDAPRPKPQENAPNPRPSWQTFPHPDTELPRPGVYFEAGSLKGSTWRHKAEEVYPYRDEDGRVFGIVCRESGKKANPFRWDGKRWINAGWVHPERKPILGLDLLKQRPLDPVLIVEGERKWRAAQCLTPYVVVSWQSGAGSAKGVDWNPLRNRDVIIWPDNDERGFQAMRDIIDAIEAKTIRTIAPPPGKPAGWDVADLLDEVQLPATVLSLMADWMRIHKIPARDLGRADDWLSPDVQMSYTKDGHPKANSPRNLWLVLTEHHDYRERFAYDVFDQKALFDNTPLDEPGIMRLLTELGSTTPRLEPGLPTLRQMASAACLSRKVNRFAADLEKLRWDGQLRLAGETLRNGYPGLLPAYARCEDTPFNRVIALRWMVGLVNRILAPVDIEEAPQHDSVLVLEGEQGYGKTSFMMRLGHVCGRFVYGELSGNLGYNKDDLQSLEGKAIIELSEMSAHRKTEIDNFRSFITKRFDRFRKPYGVEMLTHPRRCVFAGTTNNTTEYLNDPNGNRRVWPATVCAPIDISLLDTYTVEQIWAEAVHWSREGELNYLRPGEVELHNEAVKAREQSDPWDSALMYYLKDKEFVTLDDARAAIPDMTMRDWSRAQSSRLKDILIRHGWRASQHSMPDGSRPRGFARPREG